MILCAIIFLFHHFLGLRFILRIHVESGENHKYDLMKSSTLTLHEKKLWTIEIESVSLPIIIQLVAYNTKIEIEDFWFPVQSLSHYSKLFTTENVKTWNCLINLAS